MIINNDLLGTIPNDILGLKGKILWTNPNPTTATAAQTITLNDDSTNYDLLLWITEGANGGKGSTFITTGSTYNFNFSDASGSSGNKLSNTYRYITKQNSKTYNISFCYYYTQSGSSTGWEAHNNDYNLLYVIGIKLGIFN